MSETTLDNIMPRLTHPEGVEPLMEHPLRIKILDADYMEAVAIVSATVPVLRNITLQEVIRDAIHVGLPTVKKKLNAACEAVRKV